MKMRPPEGVNSVSLEGQEYLIGEDGLIEAPASYFDTMVSLGFSPRISAAEMSRDELVLRMLDRAAAHLASISFEDLAEAYEGMAKAEQSAKDAAVVNAEAVTVEQVDAMSRGELFAFLRQRGIAVGAVSNDALRKIAKDAIQPPAPAQPVATPVAEPVDAAPSEPVAAVA